MREIRPLSDIASGPCQVRGCEDPAAYVVEPGIWLCASHGMRLGPTVCRHCGVPITSAADPSGDHKSTCPRAA